MTWINQKMVGYGAMVLVGIAIICGAWVWLGTTTAIMITILDSASICDDLSYRKCTTTVRVWTLYLQKRWIYVSKVHESSRDSQAQTPPQGHLILRFFLQKSRDCHVIFIHN